MSKKVIDENPKKQKGYSYFDAEGLREGMKRTKYFIELNSLKQFITPEQKKKVFDVLFEYRTAYLSNNFSSSLQGTLLELIQEEDIPKELNLLINKMKGDASCHLALAERDICYSFKFLQTKIPPAFRETVLNVLFEKVKERLLSYEYEQNLCIVNMSEGERQLPFRMLLETLLELTKSYQATTMYGQIFALLNDDRIMAKTANILQNYIADFDYPYRVAFLTRMRKPYDQAVQLSNAVGHLGSQMTGFHHPHLAGLLNEAEYIAENIPNSLEIFKLYCAAYHCNVAESGQSQLGDKKSDQMMLTNN